ncbi:MAG: alkaline phosphatase [Verrucomicrobiales bacterium]|nr:alkaline phosphatase [Verrucomicrobiales bacterium]|tara:strand:- start:4197 stop:5075 length:879 start_codon:yes stop_codon:yes gene_type:complete
MSNEQPTINRRAFVRNGTLILGSGLAADELLAKDSKPLARIGLVTDLHHADKPTRGSRHYRESLGKLEEAGTAFAKVSVDHVVELGDFIDSADSLSSEKKHLKDVQAKFSALPAQKHHVLGNHCVHMLTKDEFLEGVQKPKTYYSFDSAGWHFVVLDSCFRSDGKPYQRNNFDWKDPNIPADELEWLAADLKQNTKPTIVFAHQRLDLSNHYAVKNAPAIRSLLEKSGKVRAVFQGHSHKNDLKEINGISYVTLVAMVEGTGAANSGYSILSLFPGESLALTGFRRQQSRSW